MRCRAVLCCDVGKRNEGAQCAEPALPGKSPDLCWTHHRALVNVEREHDLVLIPVPLARLGAP